MALTRDFKVTVRERLQRDPSFREALLTEAVDCLLAKRRGDRQVAAPRLRQCDHRVRRTRRADRQVAQEPDAHAQSEGQSAGAQPVRGSSAACRSAEGLNLKVRAVK